MDSIWSVNPQSGSGALIKGPETRGPPENSRVGPSAERALSAAVPTAVNETRISVPIPNASCLSGFKLNAVPNSKRITVWLRAVSARIDAGTDRSFESERRSEKRRSLCY